MKEERKLHCMKCKESIINKPAINHRSVLKKDGVIVRYFYCKSCRNKIVRDYRKTPTGKIKSNLNIYNSAKRYPQKLKAKELLRSKIKSGEIIRPKKCQICKKLEKIQGHHEDYSKPLEVMWLCQKCHSERHKKLKLTNHLSE